ncbi:Methionine aminopeptidase 2A, putative [Perkinsus marinus ATCC 50983]|uniref:Methionine aminopeptidase 2A, putative n=1 Tax=Perkinsus marinus (strain ATCC 50983 / TXsc) TaxID=423536 RepID=C5KQS4_PERM5|nr:Methionine aminopeptidase 2A, putative [Perkinsus marinus ATCC 50983]EER13170.1 Methionine aminopeptidase 2A, putative [Perkinsus marinus ATCC 50983]|eukprot:XP_002781375.1 Methionine aminopeptidase 2A, putative [Perkinsus marinus ATCC 50983]
MGVPDNLYLTNTLGRGPGSEGGSNGTVRSTGDDPEGKNDEHKGVKRRAVHHAGGNGAEPGEIITKNDSKATDSCEGAVSTAAAMATLRAARAAARIHRTVRHEMEPKIKPGMRLDTFVEELESRVNMHAKFDPKRPLERGWGFPTGVCLNEVAAHFTPNNPAFSTAPPPQSIIYTANDVLKVDFGVHVDGHIIDCAFSVTHNPLLVPLLETVKEATYAGIRTAGVDVRVCDVGAAVSEVAMECFVSAPPYVLRAIYNLCGHSIGNYKIHDGLAIPLVDNGDQTKMKANQLYAVETFGGAGGGITGYVTSKGESSHFMLSPYYEQFSRLLSANGKRTLSHILKRFSTMPFADRWLSAFDCGNLRELVRYNVVMDCPPLVDAGPGGYIAQFEHTIMCGEMGTEIISKGPDY